MKKKVFKGMFVVLGLLGIVAVTVATTYALFIYNKQGTNEHSITTGSITFHYDEISGKGRGINIQNAYPMDNTEALTSNDNKFEFRITSKPGTKIVEYVVTARKLSADSELDNVINAYLTNDTDSEVVIPLTKWTALPDNSAGTEKVLYEKFITEADLTNGEYDKHFTLRMWIDGATKYDKVPAQPAKCEFSDGTTVTDVTATYGDSTTCVGDGYTWTPAKEAYYPYNNKEFKVIINVNAVGKLQLNATALTYDNTKSGSSATNVQDAIDDLYTKLQ